MSPHKIHFTGQWHFLTSTISRLDN